jgi:RNA polymerase sigma-70 factor (ECF subfamily)
MPAENVNPEFPITRWTLIRKAQRAGDADAARAMNEICRSYWYPIYAYARRFGFNAEDAEDVTQDFFRNVITYDSLQATHEDKGRLRNFMLAMLKRIISKHLRHDAAEKRGGSKNATISFDDADAEARYAMEPADGHDPDAIFDQAWARDVLASAESRLRDDYVKAENLTSFEQLREFLPLGDNATPYASVARKLAINEATLRLQIHRMRKRYAKLIEQVIAETVSDEAEQKAELQHLMSVIGG